jgi:hypothetical protein
MKRVTCLNDHPKPANDDHLKTGQRRPAWMPPVRFGTKTMWSTIRVTF